MAKKGELIELKAGEIKQSFEIEHAERILRMSDNGGWELPSSSKYQFDEKNGITRSTSRGTQKQDEEETN